MKPTRRMPLFIITGASCAGKTAMCEVLFQDERKYIVIESDLLWNDIYNTPDDDYRAFRGVWMRVCRSISQIGMPVVLCGCAVPKQFEGLDERNNFTDLHYLAVICDEEILQKRLAVRRVTDANWIRSSLEFNAWLKKHAQETNPPIQLLDNSKLSPEEAAEIADKWISERMESGVPQWKINSCSKTAPNLDNG